MKITSIITILIAVVFINITMATAEPPNRNIEYATGGDSKVVFDGKLHNPAKLGTLFMWNAIAWRMAGMDPPQWQIVHQLPLLRSRNAIISHQRERIRLLRW